MLLAMAKVILDENRFDATFVKNWTNWEELEVDGFGAKGQSFEALIEALKKHYAQFTPQFAEKESGVKAEVIVKTGPRDRDRGQSLRLASVAGQRLGQSRWMAAGACADAAACADRFGRHRRWPQSERMEQVCSQALLDTAAAEELERIAVSAGMAALHSRNVVPVSAFSEGMENSTIALTSPIAGNSSMMNLTGMGSWPELRLLTHGIQIQQDLGEHNPKIRRDHAAIFAGGSENHDCRLTRVELGVFLGS